jgi:HEAT repeat protein
MPLTLACPCGQLYAVEEQHAGQQVPCPMCGRLLTIPRSQAEAGLSSSGALTGPGQSSALLPLIATVLLIFVLVSGVGVFLFWLASQPGETTASLTPASVEEKKPPPTPPKPAPRPAKKVEESPPPKRDERPPDLPPDRTPPPPPPPPAPKLAPPSSVPWKGHTAAILALGFDSTGRSLWTASGGLEEKDGKQVPVLDSTLRRWDTATGKEVGRLELNTTGIAAAAFSPTGRLAAVAGCGQNIIGLYDFERKTKIANLTEHVKPVRCLAFSPDGKLLLSGGDDHLVVAWDVASAKLRHRLEGHRNGVNQVAVGPGGKLAVSVGLDSEARVWDLEAGRPARELAGHADIVWAVALSADGRLALTGGGMQMNGDAGLVAGARDHDVRLWETDSGRLMKRFAALPGPVSALALGADGRRFLAGGYDGSLRLWQIDTGKEVKRLEGHSARVRALAFFPTGRRAVSAGEDGLLRVWDLPPDLPDLVRDLKDTDTKTRLAALSELARLGEEARPAIAPLFEALKKNDDVRPRALDVLHKLAPIDKSHVARLAQLLADRDFEAGRLFALEELARLGEEARPAAKQILAALSDPSAAVRRKALTTLTPLIDEVSGPAVRPLLAALDDNDAVVREQAEKVLDKLGRPSAAHLPALRGLLGKDRIEVRRWGLKTLAAMGIQAHPALADVAKVVRNDSAPPLRLLALEALGKIGPSDRETIDTATKALSDTEMTVSRQAAKLLARAGDVPGLLVALEHNDDEVRNEANRALARVRFDKKHIALLARLLDSRDEALRKRGAEALAGLGADAAEAVPALCKALKAASEEEQKRLLGILRKMGPAAKAAGPTVATMLKTKDPGSRLDACAILIDIKAAEVSRCIPLLIDLLKAEDTDALEDEDAKKVRDKARDLLATIGKPAVEPLREALTRDYASREARTTAGKLNAAARREVIRTLIDIGPKGRTTQVMLDLARLQRIDPDPAVREAARDARARLQRKE